MKTMSLTVVAGLAMLTGSGAGAAEIKVISSVGVKAVLEELAPRFERASEHKVKITFGTAVPLKRQIDAGESFDVVILTPALVEDLAKQGKVAAGTTTSVAKSGIGVAIRAGSPKPDIGSVEAFKRSVLNAKAIAYSKEGQSGTAMARIIERLGITEQMKPKTVLETRSGLTAANVVEGKAELAFVLISEILPIAGAELAGPLPAELQNYVVFTAGVSPGSKDAGGRQGLHRLPEGTRGGARAQSQGHGAGLRRLSRRRASVRQALALGDLAELLCRRRRLRLGEAPEALAPDLVELGLARAELGHRHALGDQLLDLGVRQAVVFAIPDLFDLAALIEQKLLVGV